jgi:hypothetical protein
MASIALLVYTTTRPTEAIRADKSFLQFAPLGEHADRDPQSKTPEQ